MGEESNKVKEALENLLKIFDDRIKDLENEKL